MRSYPRSTLAIALLAAGWIGTAATGAMAEERHGDADKATPAAASGSGNVSTGVPVIVGNDGEGHPMIEYRGAGSGTLSAGVPVISGANGEGRPQIAYLHTSPGRVDGSPASFGK